MKKECNFAIFNYNECDIELIDELSSYLDSNAKEIFTFFEMEIPINKIIINIISNKEEFDDIYEKTWNHKAESWVVGFYNRSNKEITYLSLNDYKNTSHKFNKENEKLAKLSFKKTIVHEFVHYVNDLYNIKHNYGYTEKYISEGLAVYLSKQKENEKLIFDYSLDDIMSNNCYKGWYILVKYIIENYEKEFMFSLINSNRKARLFLENELFLKVKNKYGELSKSHI